VLALESADKDRWEVAVLWSKPWILTWRILLLMAELKYLTQVV